MLNINIDICKIRVKLTVCSQEFALGKSPLLLRYIQTSVQFHTLTSVAWVLASVEAEVVMAVKFDLSLSVGQVP